MKAFIVFACLLIASCASTKDVVSTQPLNYTYLPPKVSLDTLMPTIGDTIVSNKLLDFPSISLDSGDLAAKSGILISEKKAALYIYYQSNYSYQSKKAMLANQLYSQYYNASLDAEKVYQQDIKNLTKQAERTWLERNVAYFGFIAGIASAILTEYAIKHN